MFLDIKEVKLKKASFLFPFLFLGFILIPLNSLDAQVIDIEWNTFLGTASYESSYDIAVGSSGNIYIIGESEDNWSSPLYGRVDSGYAFVACVDSSGTLIWYTFLGSESYDTGTSIALDSSENVYVTGYSEATWGTPVNAHSGGSDVFVACLDNSGNLQWNTFLGSASSDSGEGIVLDSSGNIYVAGKSTATWGSPLNAHSGNSDAFVACLDSSGNLLVNTFLGSTANDFAWGIALGPSGKIYVVGGCTATWGTPVNAYSGGWDTFVACLNSSGILQWNTFLGSTSSDSGYDIALETSGNVYVTGYSYASWGSPLNAHSGLYDGFIACLDSSGNLQWNTFLGSSGSDFGNGIALHQSGYVYITGYSEASWGSPVHAYNGISDIYVACLDLSGNLQWHTFLGSGDREYGYGVALDVSGNIYIAGYGDATWGTPVNAHSGGYDALIARITPLPSTDITANGSGGSISITQSDTLQIRVSLNSNGSLVNADFWLAYKGPSGWVHYNNSTKKWETGLGVTHQGPLMDLNNKKVFQKSGLAPGNYTFYFGVDLNMNGKITKSVLYKDEVQVTVTQ
jgi:hypothetical protein